MTLPKRESFTPEEVAKAEDLTAEAEMIEEGKETEGKVIPLTQEMRKDIIVAKDEKTIRESAGRDHGKLRAINAENTERRRKDEEDFRASIEHDLEGLRAKWEERKRNVAEAERKLRDAQKELRPGDVVEILSLAREELDREQRSIRETDKAFSQLEKDWFAQGEAVREVDGEEVGLVEMRENLGLEPGELEKIEQVFATAPKREVRDASKEFSDAIEKDLLLSTPEYREATELAEKLAKMEEKFEDYYIDIDRGKVSQFANVKNRLLIGIHRTFNKPFRKEHDEYKKLQARFETRLKDLEKLGVFAGKSRAGRALDARLRGVIDDLVGRVKGVRGR